MSHHRSESDEERSDQDRGEQLNADLTSRAFGPDEERHDDEGAGVRNTEDERKCRRAFAHLSRRRHHKKRSDDDQPSEQNGSSTLDGDEEGNRWHGRYRNTDQWGANRGLTRCHSEGEQANEGKSNKEDRPSNIAGDDADRVFVVAHDDEACNDASGQKSAASNEQTWSTRGHLFRNWGRSVKERQTKADGCQESTGRNQYTADHVVRNTIGVQKNQQASNGGSGSDSEKEQPTHRHLVRAAIGHVDRAEGQQGGTHDQENRPCHVALRPDVFLSDPLSGEDSTPKFPTLRISSVVAAHDDLVGETLRKAQLAAY